MLVHAHPPRGRATGRPRFEVADIVCDHGQAFVRAHALSADQHAVLRDIVRCRTASLGGHVNVCGACGYVGDISYNSCRNRHCPKCQSLAQARWLEARLDRILPTHYFHVVFTLPSELRALALANRRLLFKLLLTCAAETLLDLGLDPRWLGGLFAITSVLHTWARDLTFHPHVHCIVTGGGLSADGTRWLATRPNFLLPVRVLGALLRGKILDRLLRAYDAGKLKLDGPATQLADRRRFQRLCDKLRRKRWLVYVKPPFGGPEQVFRYLGRYTHRVGLSNHRLLAVTQDAVTFRTRDASTATLTPDAFLSRFVLHVLPRRFVKIRHCGLMAAGNVKTKLPRARCLLEDPHTATSTPARPVPRPPRDFRELLLALTGIDVRRCPRCGADMGRLPLLDKAAATQPPAPFDTS